MKNNLGVEEILTKLFGSVSRARIIELLISQVGRAFYQREIMYETGLSLHPTQRELENLTELGIVKKRETRDRVYYEVDAHSPFSNPFVKFAHQPKEARGKWIVTLPDSIFESTFINICSTNSATA